MFISIVIQTTHIPHLNPLSGHDNNVCLVIHEPANHNTTPELHISTSCALGKLVFSTPYTHKTNYEAWHMGHAATVAWPHDTYRMPHQGIKNMRDECARCCRKYSSHVNSKHHRCTRIMRTICIVPVLRSEQRMIWEAMFLARNSPSAQLYYQSPQNKDQYLPAQSSLA